MQRRAKLSRLARPFICGVVAEATPRECIGQIDRFEASGVDSFEINIAPLGETERLQESLKDIFSSTSKPCIATNRRRDFMRFYGFRNIKRIGEEERAKRLVKALEHGASVVDYELDLFDLKETKPVFGSRAEILYASRRGAAPTEVTKKPYAVKRQAELAWAVRSLGGEVMISCHSQTRIKKADALGIVSEMEKRGADFAKLVMFTMDNTDFAELVGTVASLRRQATIPFNLMNLAKDQILGRLVSNLCGSSWIYCRPAVHSRHTFTGQPTVEEARKFLTKYGSLR